MNGRRILPWSVFFLGLLIALPLLPFLQTVSACDVEVETPTDGVGVVPPISSAAAVAMDDRIYLFGGSNASGMLDTIYMFDPVADTCNVLDTKLPVALANSMAVSDGERAYIIGGVQKGNGTYNANLTVFTPPNDLVVYENFFPWGLKGNSLAFDGSRYIYVFGNCLSPNGCNKSSGIRIDVQELGYDVLPDVLPRGIAGSNAIFYDDTIYIIGGKYKNDTGDQVMMDRVIEYMPGEEKASELDLKLPTPIMAVALARLDDYIMIIGGDTSDGPSDKIIAFDPKEDTIEYTSQNLSCPRVSRTCAVIGDKAFIVGGAKGTGARPVSTIESVALVVEEDNDDYEAPNYLYIVLLGASSVALVVVIAVQYKMGKKNAASESSKKNKQKVEEKEPKEG